MERSGQPEKRSPLNLGLDRIGIDVHAAINRTDDPLDFHRAIGRHLDLGDLRRVTPVCELYRNPAAMPCGKW